jgi:hypothetical protein
MADYAPKTPEVEHHDEPEVVDQKAKALVDLIIKSKHFIAFTGAGISTSAGQLQLPEQCSHDPPSNRAYAWQAYPTFAAPRATGRSWPRDDSVQARPSARFRRSRRRRTWRSWSCRIEGS